MNTRRLSMVATLTLTMVGSAGLAVVAQGDESGPPPTDFAYSTSTFLRGDVQEGENVGAEDEGPRERGGSVTIQVEGGDPRVNGDLRIQPFNADEDPEWIHGIFWGTGRLETEDGSWLGPLQGITHEQGITSVGWLRGAGGYEGFTWFFRATAPWGVDYDYEGSVAESLIYRGDPPPLLMADE